jgi:hypothetical protein
MLVLFDHSTPAPLRHALKSHVVVDAIERGWDGIGWEMALCSTQPRLQPSKFW